MTAQPVTWNQIAHLFWLLAHVYRQDGKIRMPAADEVPSPDIEIECDHWCRAQAEDLRFPLNPPERIRPWMLARVISVAALAETLAQQNEKSPGQLNRKIVEQLLIAEWHGALRERWKRIPQPPPTS